MNEYRFSCHERDNLRQQIIRAGNACIDLLKAGAVEIIVRPYRLKRTLEQNAMLHGICRQIGAQRQWHGMTLDEEGWKRLFVDAWMRERGSKQVRIVPSLDGSSIVQLGRQTSKMDTAELSELIEFSLAWAATEGIEVKYESR